MNVFRAVASLLRLAPLVVPFVAPLVAALVAPLVAPPVLGGAHAASAQAVDPPTHRVLRLGGDDFSDLEFLRGRLRGVRVVQLGESGHGMAEASRIKARLVRFLHEEMGFGVIAFESSLYQCHDADARADGAPARTTLLRCVFGVWHTEEVLELFEHLRASREEGGGRPLRLAGIDIQPIGPNKDHRPAFLGRIGAALGAAGTAVDPAAVGERIATLDSAFLRVYALDGAERRAALRERRDELVEGYETFAALVESRLEEVEAAVDRADALVAAQTARSMAAYVRMQTSPDMKSWAETRDRGMADNVAFLAERLFPGEKIVVWAANYHVRHANERIPATEAVFPGVPARAMGGRLRDRFGDELVTVGIYGYEGAAVDNAREPYEVPPAPEGSLETLALPPGGASGPVFVDLRPTNGPPPPWARRAVIARYNGLHPQWLVPADQYDAIIVLPRVSPPRFLY